MDYLPPRVALHMLCPKPGAWWNLDPTSVHMGGLGLIMSPHHFQDKGDVTDIDSNKESLHLALILRQALCKGLLWNISLERFF